MKIKRILIEVLFCGLIGYLILHPVSMIIIHMDAGALPLSLSNIWHCILTAFSLSHLRMGIFFIILGISIGIIYSYYTWKIVNISKKIKVLEGLLPICSQCKKIRDESNFKKDKWMSIEMYIAKNSKLNFTHGICPECEKKQMDELNKL